MPVFEHLCGDVEQVVGTNFAFAALKADGSVITWGREYGGGDSFAVRDDLSRDVRHIARTCFAFAAVKTDGSVITWGDPEEGGDSDAVREHLCSDVMQVFGTGGAFAALRVDGSVITWGNPVLGGNCSAVRRDLNSDVTEVVGTFSAFVVVKADGAVISEVQAVGLTVNDEKTAAWTQESHAILPDAAERLWFDKRNVLGTCAPWLDTDADFSRPLRAIKNLSEILIPPCIASGV